MGGGPGTYAVRMPRVKRRVRAVACAGCSVADVVCVGCGNPVCRSHDAKHGRLKARLYETDTNTREAAVVPSVVVVALCIWCSAAVEDEFRAKPGTLLRVPEPEPRGLHPVVPLAGVPLLLLAVCAALLWWGGWWR